MRLCGKHTHRQKWKQEAPLPTIRCTNEPQTNPPEEHVKFPFGRSTVVHVLHHWLELWIYKVTTSREWYHDMTRVSNQSTDWRLDQCILALSWQKQQKIHKTETEKIGSHALLIDHGRSTSALRVWLQWSWTVTLSYTITVFNLVLN